LADGPELRALRAAPGVRLAHIDPQVVLAQAQRQLGGEGLTALYARLERTVMRADMLRAAILYLQGGIYLDMDTITVASLRPLLEAPQFLGTEFIVWPAAARNTRSPLRLARPVLLDLLRQIMRGLPDGWRLFRRVEGWYFRGVNNAVMGAQPGAPFFAAYLRAMAQMPPSQLGESYALGPDLLQTLVSHYSNGELVIHPPHVFYPLPPEISVHWFRPRPDTLALAQVLLPATRVVHWYASVRSKPYVARISPAYVRANRQRQFYSALVCHVLPKVAGVD
jgi:hypothetical protein